MFMDTDMVIITIIIFIDEVSRKEVEVERRARRGKGEEWRGLVTGHWPMDKAGRQVERGTPPSMDTDTVTV